MKRNPRFISGLLTNIRLPVRLPMPGIRVRSTQPEGDDGGNAVKLTAPANLHTYWDDVLGGGNSPLTALNSIATLPTVPPAAMNDLDVSHWIHECFDAAKATVYKTPMAVGAGPFTLTPTYKTKARTVAEQRDALAGAR